MYNFFVNEPKDALGQYYIIGADYNHIKNVLRMNVGDEFLVSFDGKSDLCRLAEFSTDTVIAEVISDDYQATELPVRIHLLQGLPKGDKLELIIQKAVELGVATVTPDEMKYSVVKLDDKKKKSKVARWQAVAESAAKQSKRSSIPEVLPVCDYSTALNMAKDYDLLLVPYENENGMADTVSALQKLKNCKNVGILIGPEGGFSEDEIEKAKNMGGISISLGKRILRTETAAITAVGMCMLQIEMDNGENI